MLVDTEADHPSVFALPWTTGVAMTISLTYDQARARTVGTVRGTARW